MKLLRKLPDGSLRPIGRVPGGPPMPTGTVQSGEAIFIETVEGTVEVTMLDSEEALVRMLPGSVVEHEDPDPTI